MIDGHPAYPVVSARSIVGAEPLWVYEADFDYGGETGVWRIWSIIELSGERIARGSRSTLAP